VAEGAHLFVSALDGIVAPGRYGRKTAGPGVTVSEVRGAGLATVTVRNGRHAALLEAAQSGFGVELPATPKRVEGREFAFVWSGPDQWLACRHPAPAEGMETLLAAPFAGLASVVDQSHGRTLLRVAGPHARDALAKGVPIDLHPRAFKAGDAAATLVSHIAVQLWQIDDRPTYEFAVARSLAQSFWHWLEASAAQYGLEFVDRPTAIGDCIDRSLSPTSSRHAK
jgi:methylglutamate dehydrogenase subunit D